MHGLYWLTVNLAEHRSMAILIDDVHWADDFTLRYLVFKSPNGLKWAAGLLRSWF